MALNLRALSYVSERRHILANFSPILRFLWIHVVMFNKTHCVTALVPKVDVEALGTKLNTKCSLDIYYIIKCVIIAPLPHSTPFPSELFIATYNLPIQPAQLSKFLNNFLRLY